MTDPFVLPDPTSQQARALESTAGDGYVAVVMLEAALKDEEVEGPYLDTLREYEPGAGTAPMPVPEATPRPPART